MNQSPVCFKLHNKMQTLFKVRNPPLSLSLSLSLYPCVIKYYLILLSLSLLASFLLTAPKHNSHFRLKYSSTWRLGAQEQKQQGTRQKTKNEKQQRLFPLSEYKLPRSPSQFQQSAASCNRLPQSFQKV